MAKVVNFIAFQAGWWGCVLGAAAGEGWIGPSLVGAAVAVHLATTDRRRGALALMLFSGFLGLLLDGLLAANDLLRFPADEGPWVGPLPLWMVALWVNIAPTLGSSLGWLRGRYVRGGLFGLLGGPTTYYAGTRLGALRFAPDTHESWLALAVTWTLSMVLLLLATERCLPAADATATGGGSEAPGGAHAT